MNYQIVTVYFEIQFYAHILILHLSQPMALLLLLEIYEMPRG